MIDTSPFPGETAMFADLILSDHTYLERLQDTPTYPFEGGPMTALRTPAVEPVHDTKVFGDIVIEIGKRIDGPMGDYYREIDSTENLLRHLAKGFTDEPARVSPDIREAYPDEETEWSPPYEMPGHKQNARTGVGVHRKGVVWKCTFCAHKIREAPEGVSDLDPDDPELVEYVPACVRTCAPTARYLGDLDDPESKVNQLIADKRGMRLLDHTGNRPQVYYLTGEHGAIPAFDDKQS